MTRRFAFVVGLAFLASLVLGAGRLWAGARSVEVAPALISYQGFLAASNGDPLADASYPMRFAVYDAANAGTKIWEEDHATVPVANGFFAVLLGSGSCTTGCPLGPGTFASTTRYLQASVNTGSGYVAFPRQRLASVPYALQAASVPWSGITGVPAGLGSVENVITVAKSGGDYTSVAEALASISNASANNRYLVRVAPGVYTETSLSQVKAYVHLQGSGPNATVVTSARSAASPGNSAATIQLDDNGRVSDISIVNTGTGVYGLAIYSAEASRNAVVDTVTARAIGAGGTGHYAAFMNDSEPTILRSTLLANGATGFGTGVNAAFASVNISGGFPQALIVDSILLGGHDNVNDKEACTNSSGTGFGMQLANSSPTVRGSYICGGHRGIFLGINGNVLIENSVVKVSSTGSAFLFEITSSGSISLASSGVSYVGNKFTGAGTGLRCVHAYDTGTWAALTNGTTAAAACNTP
jgi:hypothetical protein